jgi:lysine-N-methylase
MPVDARQRACYQEKAPQLLAAIDPEAGIMRRGGAQQACNQLCEGGCNIQAQYGEEMLGDACYFYPRTLHAVAGQYRMVGDISCPEMLRIILSEPQPFAVQDTLLGREPQPRRDLVPDGWSAAQVDALHAHAMAIAGDNARPPEEALAELLHLAELLTEAPTGDWRGLLPLVQQRMAMTEPAALPAAAYAVYYALALLEAFGTANPHARLCDIMATMEQQLDCRFDRAARSITMGADSFHVHARLVGRWQIDARTSLAPVLRRWLQAQVAMTYFPFGGFADITMLQRAAIMVQRFATVRLALMCHVAPNGVPPDEETVIRVIQGVARFMNHIADAKLTLMIHRDSGWVDTPRLRGLIAGV